MGVGCFPILFLTIKYKLTILKNLNLMVKKQLFCSDYTKPEVVDIAVRVESGFAASDQFEKLPENESDNEF